MMNVNDIKIEKGIPISKQNRREYNGKWKSFTKKLIMGDSFKINASNLKELRSIQVSVNQCARRQGIKIISRREDDLSIRFWKVS